MSKFLTDLKTRKERQDEEAAKEAAALLAEEEQEKEKTVEEELPVEEEVELEETTKEPEVSEVEEEKKEITPLEKVEIIPLDLFQKLLLHTHSEIRTDEGIKQIIDKVYELVEEKGNLTLEDYEEILSSVQEEEPKASESKSLYKEGATATNPNTGEKVIYRKGEWQRLDG